MRYVGGKYRIATRLAPLIDTARIHTRATAYVEPFLGGAATFTLNAPRFRHAIGADVVPDLVAMWTAARDGWVPPADLDEATYAALRDAEPSALRGFAGFGCSFGGKWFGGYARARIVAGKTLADPDAYNEAASSSARIVRQARGVPAAEYVLADYRDLAIPPGAVVYADPPYAGTTGYGAAGAFDPAEFWHVAQGWAQAGAAVLVSEHAAPAPWVEVWSHALPDFLSGANTAGARVERLFALPELAELYAGDAALFDLEAPA